MAAIPVVVLFLFLQKYIVGGLTAGAGQSRSDRSLAVRMSQARVHALAENLR